eukprot:1161185-Pelagomonas_calceolata.AAC.3
MGQGCLQESRIKMGCLQESRIKMVSARLDGQGCLQESRIKMVSACLYKTGMSTGEQDKHKQCMTPWDMEIFRRAGLT